MSNKIRNHINVRNALMLFSGGYALQAKQFNFYQFRIVHEEHKSIFYDWYHTTGSLVRNNAGVSRSMGKIPDPEDCAIAIKKDLESHT